MMRHQRGGTATIFLAAVVLVGTGCVGESEDSSGTGSSDADRITLNSGNQLQAPNTTRYEEPWTVLVTDAQGNPVEGVTVTLSIDPLFYFKGRWITIDTDGDGTPDEWGKGFDSNDDGQIDQQGAVWQCNNEDRLLAGLTGFEGSELNGILDTEDSNGNGALDSGEDINGNGTLDTEDLDGDGQLEPSRDSTVIPGTVETNQNGFAEFKVAYPKGNATWSTVRLTAEAEVEGTERAETRRFQLRVLVEDVSDINVTPPGGTGGPYGQVADCSNPN